MEISHYAVTIEENDRLEMCTHVVTKCWIERREIPANFARVEIIEYQDISLEVQEGEISDRLCVVYNFIIKLQIEVWDFTPVQSL